MIQTRQREGDGAPALEGTWFRRVYHRALRRLCTTSVRPYVTAYPRLSVRREVKIPVLGGIGSENTALSEPWLFPILAHLLTVKEGAMIDVGVNLGQTLIKLLALDGTRRYVGFEPNPQCVNYATAVAVANGARQVTIVPCGLSDRFGVVRLYSRGPTDSAASVIEGFRDSREYSDSSLVCIAPGDDVLSNIEPGPVAIIKVDVEGGELEVLAGLSQTIIEHRPFVLCEVLPVYDEATAIGAMRRERADGLLRRLGELDYDIYRMSHNSKLNRLSTIPTHGRLELSDYLFAPRETASALGELLQSA
jgi:FkbM family methyltransferase